MMSSDEQGDLATEQLIARVQDNPLAMLMLARTLLLPRGKTARAYELSEAAVRLAPDNGEVSALARMVRARCAAAWYFTMVQDHSRHAKYAAAFRQVLASGCTVLDIGAGTGLFAMLAAREGAGRVIACERDSVIADGAREIVRVNGLSDRVSVIAKDSRELKMGEDLEGPADVLLWDNLTNDLLGVGALDAISDAHHRLLKPGARVIPRRCELRVALVKANPSADVLMGIVEGFDLSPFNRFRPTQTTLNRTAFERRSAAETIFDFDFSSEREFPEQRGQAMVTATGGAVDGVAQWLRFHLTDDIRYDTGDDQGVTAFAIQYHAVEPFESVAGQRVAIAGAHDRQRTWFWIDRLSDGRV